jgi:hypothetical protein
MHLHGQITVHQTIDQVWEFFNNLSNLARWDRSVAHVIPTSPTPYGLGSTFDTISPARTAQKEGSRLSYRVTQYIPHQQVTCSLISSSLFRRADWITTTERVAEGVRIICSVDCTLRPRYRFLIPILLLTYKGAFQRDLLSLKQTMEGTFAIG